ncbi:MAG: TlpA disulfide reductase family protein [Bacteroidales bacterium]|jgi:thiol-disulfide isomerase/thioredoxin
MKEKTYKIGLLLLLMLIQTAIQAKQIQDITPLRIGDKVPEELWEMSFTAVNQEGGENISLGNYRDKLIILDFWSTWCAPCIKAIPKFEKLQHDLKNDVQFIMVTSQSKEAISQFFRKRNVKLPSVVGDTLLTKIFPHGYVPHEVWIKDGKIFAITDEKEVTLDNIGQALNGRIKSFPEQKFNFDYDLTQPLLLNKNGGGAKDLLYHSLFTGYLDGIGGGGVFPDSSGRYKIRALNGNVLQLYLFAIRYVNKPLSYTNRCILDFDKQEEVLPPPEVPAYSPVVRDKYYCYELIVPVGLKEMAPQLMLEDLNRFFGAIYNIQGTVEKRRVKCWVLKKKGSIENLVSKSDSPGIITNDSNLVVYHKQPFLNFYNAMVSLYSKEMLPIIDSTGIKSEIDICFPSKEKDIFKFKSFLNQYGLDLEQELCEIDMLVIK